MIRDITIGRYFDSESVIHRMDPRTKLMGAIVYIISLFLVKNPLWYLLCLAVILTLYKIAKVPFGYLLRGLKGIILLLLFTFLFRMLYTPGDVIGSFWIFSVTEQGIVKAIQMTARIALMIAGASLLSYTSTPKELADGLEKAFSKTEKLGIPIHEMSVIVMIAFRFIPIMLDELNLLMDAQAARGAKFGEGSIIEKCKGVITLLLPLFLMTVRRSSDLAMAIGGQEDIQEVQKHQECIRWYMSKEISCIRYYYNIFFAISIFENNYACNLIKEKNKESFALTKGIIL